MNEQPLQYIIESILFAYGEPIKAAKLAAVLNTGVEQIEEAVRLLQYEYDENRRGFNIIRCLRARNIIRLYRSFSASGGFRLFPARLWRPWR